MITGRMSTPTIVPIHRGSKNIVQVLIRDNTESVEYFMLERLDDSLNMRLEIRRHRSRSLDLTTFRFEHSVKRFCVFAVVVAAKDLAFQSFLVLEVHRKVAGLLSSPVAAWAGRAGRYPNLSRAEMDDDRDQLPDPRTKLLAVPHQDATILIAQRDPPG